jgi:integrase
LRLSLRLLNTFLAWTAEQDELTGLVSIDAAKSMRAKDAAGKPTPRKNTLRRDQLEAWFTEVRKIPNPSISAYLQCTLLTGRRREEIGFIKWSDVNFKWNTIQIKDKTTLLTTIPLTSYMTHLLKGLPRSNEWVFSSVRSASGRLIVPSAAHKQACATAGLDLSIHDLRRSLATLCEWLELPPGLVAQLQGHAPQGVREKHYIDRPMDLLSIFHEQIEAWILMEAKQNFAHPSKPTKSIYAL